jgi:putative flippase GtrA
MFQALLTRLPKLRRFGRLIRFSLVGLSGIAVNSAVLWMVIKEIGLPVLPGSMLATEVAIISNFLLNDCWTFRHIPPSHPPLAAC